MAITKDLREWLKEVEKMEELKVLEGANWELEIGCLCDLNNHLGAPAMLFDKIKDYPSGYRVLCAPLLSNNRVALTFGLPLNLSDKEMITAFREKLPEWEAKAADFAQKVIKKGSIMENVLSGDDIDLFRFPVPKWHEGDGGRYIGTGDAVITRDPDTGQINLGTYRIMVHDKKTAAVYISPGHHGRIHYEKYHKRGERCPMAISVGHHPLILGIGCQNLTMEEYNFTGVVCGKPVEVIIDDVTGLPIPADAEIVITGWCPPEKTKMEGPFGEWTGYYASKERLAPILEVERVYFSSNPIILGSPPSRPPSEMTHFSNLVKSATIHNFLLKSGIPDVQAVWINDATGAPFMVVSIKQRYPGHAKQAALLASQSRMGAYCGRYVVVVDEDIDPMNLNDVLWAMGFRSDPAGSIDIIRKAWSTPLDPMIRKPTTAFYNSRAIIDACKPYDWIDEFPKEVKSSPELLKKTKERWDKVLSLDKF